MYTHQDIPYREKICCIFYILLHHLYIWFYSKIYISSFRTLNCKYSIIFMRSIWEVYIIYCTSKLKVIFENCHKSKIVNNLHLNHQKYFIVIFDIAVRWKTGHQVNRPAKSVGYNIHWIRQSHQTWFFLVLMRALPSAWGWVWE